MNDNPLDQYRDPSHLSTRIDLHARFSTNPLGWHRWLFDQLSLKSGQSLLDVGCGNGLHWVSNAKAIPAGATITLADLSPGMAAAARLSLSGRPALSGSCAASIETLPFADASCDIVLASHMMYHVDDIPRALREVKRILRKGGCFLCTTNGQSHMKQLGEVVKSAAANWPGFTYIDRFGLENAPSFLKPHFESVELKLYPDSLEITDAAAAADYAMSMQTVRELGVDLRQSITDAVEKEIRKTGRFATEKESGAFVCS